MSLQKRIEIQGEATNTIIENKFKGFSIW